MCYNFVHLSLKKYLFSMSRAFVSKPDDEAKDLSLDIISLNFTKAHFLSKTSQIKKSATSAVGDRGNSSRQRSQGQQHRPPNHNKNTKIIKTRRPKHVH